MFGVRVAALFVLCVGLAAQGCRRQDARVVEQPPPERVRVGAFMSLSGDTAQYGISALNGIRMAVEEANAAGGVKGHRVDLVVRERREEGFDDSSGLMNLRGSQETVA